MRAVVVSLGLILAATQPLAHGAFERMPVGPRSVGLSGAGVVMAGDPFAAFINPALMENAGGPGLSASYAPSLFGLEELSRSAAAVLLPFRKGAAGASASVFGNGSYRESSFSVEGMWEFIPGCRAGVRLALLNLRIQEYGSATVLGIDLGFLVQLTEGIALGGAIGPVNAPAIGASGEPLPQTLSFGVCCRPVREAALYSALVFDQLFRPEFRIGVEYAPVPMLTFRAGICPEPSACSFGASITCAIVSIEYAVSGHPELGLSQVFGVSIVLE